MRLAVDTETLLMLLAAVLVSHTVRRVSVQIHVDSLTLTQYSVSGL